MTDVINWSLSLPFLLHVKNKYMQHDKQTVFKCIIWLNFYFLRLREQLNHLYQIFADTILKISQIYSAAVLSLKKLLSCKYISCTGSLQFYQSTMCRVFPMFIPDWLAPLFVPICRPMIFCPALSCSSVNSRLLASASLGPYAPVCGEKPAIQSSQPFNLNLTMAEESQGRINFTQMVLCSQGRITNPFQTSSYVFHKIH